MNSPSVAARLAAVAGGAALIAMASLVASCGTSENPAPTSTTSTTTPTSPSATPTEKVLNPSNPNKFSPTVIAPPAPTESGGNHHHGLNGIG
ncbi:hypothetical protein [Mycobacterium sp. shizuoka-1]|uniref:hypothetical protein n=1 Tax=Mycobacterium sp. shizuoka-1 TaxID=2039281 RepID=UPI000C067610|nr:hypothetical protein [Mycobacterium sp. shizuoka-1]GAY17099.1 hypothetical protein MSZK_38250 [Mycobacterium sp. shizuoka-1]